MRIECILHQVLEFTAPVGIPNITVAETLQHQNVGGMMSKLWLRDCRTGRFWRCQLKRDNYDDEQEMRV
jgi:hypothetical protein